MRETTDAAAAFARYQSLRHRFPQAAFPASAQHVDDLGGVADRYDTFVFDSFGVLNIGTTAIPSAIARIQMLRALKKNVFVLTNAASTPLENLRQKYADLGFDFAAHEIISSRAVLSDALNTYDPAMQWAVIAPDAARIDTLPCRTMHFRHADPKAIDGVIFLSSIDWTHQDQSVLAAFFERYKRPLLVGNPDLAAPLDSSISIEPGTYAHALADSFGIEPVFFGKPFGNAFEYLIRSARTSIDVSKTLMIGDTLHTDILGGRAAGMDTALVTAHGVLRDLDIDVCMTQSGIIPDVVMPTI